MSKVFMSAANQIDTFKESVLSLDDAAKHVSKITGQKRNRHVLLRWARRGVAGVVLVTIQIGGEIYTSREKLNEFLNQSRDAKLKRHGSATAEGIRRRNLQVETEADELGI